MRVASSFRPAFWLTNPHAQTIFASQCRPMPKLAVTRERLELEDGDFLDLSWLPERGLPDAAPVVIVLHGLNGGLASKYARGLLQRVEQHGGRGLLLHFRGAGKPNRLPCSYHSGETGDLARVIAHVRHVRPQASLAVVGYSLGGNVLLKYLGEQGEHSPLACAVAVSVPFDLAQCAEALNHGLSRLYRAYMLRGMRAVTRAKFNRIESPIDLPDLDGLRDFAAFDDAVTAPLNGFADAADYYRRSSSSRWLRHVRTPTLILQAADDPFTATHAPPADDDLSASIRLEWSARGGHVGFVSAGRRGRPIYWLEQRIPAWLRDRLPGFGGESVA